jgi:ankyrin repeat protein
VRTLLAAWLAVAVRAADGDGSTPLHWACHRNDAAEVDRLIRSGADVNAATDLGVTPLWVASHNGSGEIVARLLGAGANPNAALASGETPLMVAARSGYADIVERLLAKRANPDSRATRGQTALMWAASQKHAKVVRLLVAAGADIHARSESWSQMMAVPPHGYPGNNKMVPHGGDTALMFAARSGDLDSARILVEAQANVNDADAWGVTATVMAAHSGFTELLEFLLSKGADPNKADAGFAALHQAILRRDERMVRALLARGADPNLPLRTWTPTRRSSRDFHFPPPLVGATPYWLAARFHQPAVMRLLAAKGADPRVVHRSRSISDKGYREKVEVTTAVTAALGAGGGTAWVPPPAAERDALLVETVRTAVELGVDLSVANTDGRTAMDVARGGGLAEVAAILAAR